MFNWKDLSLNARIALCLVLAEKMIPKIETMIGNYEIGEMYAKGKRQIYDILSLAWRLLEDIRHTDWMEMYLISTIDGEWVDDENDNRYGYFDFILELNCENDEEARVVSNMMIFCFYYPMYRFAERQNKALPQDLEWFRMEESEAKAFLAIDKAISLYLPKDEQEKINNLKNDLLSLFPYNEAEPYGKYFTKQTIFGLLD